MLQGHLVIDAPWRPEHLWLQQYSTSQHQLRPAHSRSHPTKASLPSPTALGCPPHPDALRGSSLDGL